MTYDTCTNNDETIDTTDVMLPRMLVCGHEQRSPKHLWDEKLKPYRIDRAAIDASDEAANADIRRDSVTALFTASKKEEEKSDEIHIPEGFPRAGGAGASPRRAPTPRFHLTGTALAHYRRIL